MIIYLACFILLTICASVGGGQLDVVLSLVLHHFSYIHQYFKYFGLLKVINCFSGKKEHVHGNVLNGKSFAAVSKRTFLE